MQHVKTTTEIKCQYRTDNMSRRKIFAAAGKIIASKLISTT